MTQVRAQDGVNVDDGVGDDELEEPAHQPAKGRGHDDSARAGDVGVAALLGQVEWRIVARHGPDDGDEGHEDRDAVGEVGAHVEVAPDRAALGEARETLVRSSRGCGDGDDDNNQGDDVERAPVRVERGDPPRRHGRNHGVDDHEERRKKKNLIVGRHVGRVVDGSGREDHGRECVVD